MAYIAPNSTVILIKGVPFDPTYENTMYFSTKNEQKTYFTSLQNRQLDNLSYARKGVGHIRAQISIADAYQYNYMMYKNTDFENKWWYAFVTKVEYVNNETTDIFFDIDLLQTWHFDYGFNECFIERQHTASDRIGENLIEEDLGLGEFVWDDNTTLEYKFTPCIVVVCNVNMHDISLIPPRFNPMPGIMYTGRVPGYSEYFAGCQFQIWDPNHAADVSTYLNDMANAGYADSILAVFMGAGAFIEDIDSDPPFTPTTLYWSHSIKTTQYVNGEAVTGYFIGKDYMPRNKKLMCSPYNFLYVHSSSGNGHAYRYEYFSNPDNFDLAIWGNTSCNPGIILWPLAYKGGACYDESISITNFPLCCWSYDTFKAWLAQNIGTLGLGLGGSIANLITGNQTVYKPIKADGETIGLRARKADEKMVSGSVSNIFQLAGNTFDMARRPPTKMGDGNGDLLYSTLGISFRSYHKHILPEIAMKYDQYFDMYGYKVNRIGLPGRNVRPCYTYVKTVGCSIKDTTNGCVPADDARAIEALYNKGIRWWQPNAVFGSYHPDDNNNLPFGGGQ